MVESKIMEKSAIKFPEEAPLAPSGFGTRHLQMLCMFCCMIALLMTRSTMGVAILAMTDVHQNSSSIEIYKWDKNTQGLILSSFFWGYMPMQIPAGLLAKKFGGKPILLVALLANGIINGLFPTLASLGGWPMVCVTRVAMGMTQACLYPASHTLLGRWLPSNERTSYSGIVYSGPQIGVIIAMPVSGWLAATALGWKTIFYFTSAVTFLIGGMWYWFSASTPAEHFLISEGERRYIEMGINKNGVREKADQATPWKAMLCTPALWAIVVSQIGGTIEYILVFVDLPTFLEKAMNIPLKDSATLSALPYIGMGFGNVVSSVLCEEIYNRGWLSVVVCRKLFNSLALCGGAVCLVFLSFLGTESKNLAIVMLVTAFTLYGFTSAGFMVNHLDLSPHFAGVMLSISNCIGGLAMVGTPVLTGFILQNDPTDLSRWRIMFLLTAGLLVATNLVYVIFGKAELVPWDSPDYKDKKMADPEEMAPVLDKNKLKELEANQQAED